MKHLILVVLLLSGCATANDYLGRTSVNYEAMGVKASYDSNKNQQDFHVKLSFDDAGKLKSADIATTAVTPESAIAAVLQQNTEMLKLIQALMAKIPQK